MSPSLSLSLPLDLDDVRLQQEPSTRPRGKKKITAAKFFGSITFFLSLSQGRQRVAGFFSRTHKNKRSVMFFFFLSFVWHSVERAQEARPSLGALLVYMCCYSCGQNPTDVIVQNKRRYSTRPSSGGSRKLTRNSTPSRRSFFPSPGAQVQSRRRHDGGHVFLFFFFFKFINNERERATWKRWYHHPLEKKKKK